MNYKKLNGDEKILLSHGGGGRETAALIKDILFAEFYGPDSNIIDYDNGQNQIKLLEDAAISEKDSLYHRQLHGKPDIFQGRRYR